LFEVINLDMVPERGSSERSIDNPLPGALWNNRGCLMKVASKEYSDTSKWSVISHYVPQGAIQSFNGMTMLHRGLIPNDDVGLSNELCKLTIFEMLQVEDSWIGMHVGETTLLKFNGVDLGSQLAKYAILDLFQKFLLLMEDMLETCSLLTARECLCNGTEAVMR
jgi:hypothetical protein